MTQRLYIGLPEDGSETLTWLLWDRERSKRIDSGQAADESGYARLRELSQRLPAVAIAPGTRLSVFSVELPVSGKTAAAALPFHLEESLADDPGDLHICSEPLQAGQPGLAIAADHAAMSQWYNLIDQQSIRLACALPACCLIPPGHGILDRDQVILKTTTLATQVDRDSLAQICAGLSTQDLQLSRCDDAEVPTVLANAEINNAASLLEAVAAVTDTVPPWTVFTGRYRLGTPAGRWLKRLRWPIAATAAALLLHWATLGLEIADHKRQSDLLSDEMVSLYRRAFPEQQRVPRPRRQMEAYLENLESSAAGNNLMAWLGSSSDALAVLPAAGAEELRYSTTPESLRLQLQLKDFDALNSFSSAMEQAGNSVQRGSFNQENNQLRGHVIIRRAQP